jgi:OTU domain-containing protein 5
VQRVVDKLSRFVVGDAADFERYVGALAHPGVWGDEPELQALCELYDRPAEVWAYCPARGARTVNDDEP